MVAMHFAYSDRSKVKARIAELTLVGASVVFLTTTFADSQLYATLGLDADVARVILGIASAAAFFCSIALVIVDWAGTAALHREAAKKFSSLVLRFRQNRLDSNTWPDEIADELSAEYESVSASTVGIPDRKFVALKTAYLRKKKVSELASEHPGAPLFILKLLVHGTGIRSAWNGVKEKTDDAG